jgi:hypothetical protein
LGSKRGERWMVSAIRKTRRWSGSFQ